MQYTMTPVWPYWRGQTGYGSTVNKALSWLWYTVRVGLNTACMCKFTLVPVFQNSMLMMCKYIKAVHYGFTSTSTMQPQILQDRPLESHYCVTWKTQKLPGDQLDFFGCKCALSYRAVSVAFCDRTGSDVFIRDDKKDKKKGQEETFCCVKLFFTHKKTAEIATKATPHHAFFTVTLQASNVHYWWLPKLQSSKKGIWHRLKLHHDKPSRNIQNF